MFIVITLCQPAGPLVDNPVIRIPELFFPCPQNISDIWKVGKIGILRIIGQIGKVLNFSTLFKLVK